MIIAGHPRYFVHVRPYPDDRRTLSGFAFDSMSSHRQLNGMTVERQAIDGSDERWFFRRRGNGFLKIFRLGVSPDYIGARRRSDSIMPGMIHLERSATGRQQISQHEKIVGHGNVSLVHKLLIFFGQPVGAVVGNDDGRRIRRQQVADVRP
jgi:hypothetical protein